jgi:hypothetical protein
VIILKITQATIEQLEEVYGQAYSYFENLKRQVSNIDLQMQDILHYIESSSFSASKGYLLAKIIKNIRIKRRVTKNEFELLQSVITILDKNKIDIEGLKKRAEKRIQAQLNETFTPKVVDFSDVYKLFDISFIS